MAKNRLVNTRFWDDTYISNLDPIEKLLFLYFITNTSTNICGIYEIPIKKIASETGIDKDMVLKIVERFSNEEKVFYIDGWIVVKNFIKHQNQRSPKVQRGIEIELENVPENIKNLFFGYGIDTLSHSNSNSNTNSNTNSNSNPNSNTKVVVEKKKYGEFENVLLFDTEYEKLIQKLGEHNTQLLIEELSGYIASKKTKYASHYATLLNWARRKIEKKTTTTNNRYIA